MKGMKIIALEEHFRTHAIEKALEKLIPPSRIPDAPWSDTSFRDVRYIYDGPGSHLYDLGTDRFKQMDAMGIDVQVLSYSTPAMQILSAAEAVPMARDANDQLAAAVAAHPDHFVGFATLPTADPQAAAAELKRAVQQLGFKGAMINGRAGYDRFLDDSRFSPILEAAETLDVPIYIHPIWPSKAVQDDYYSGFDPVTSAWFACTGWGWHMETGVHALRMILAGIFDRYPRLQIILGHWGEFIPFYLARLDQLHQFKHLKQRMSDYFLQNFYVTPSGLYTYPPLLLTLQTMGADRIMYSVDYPYVIDEHARTFLENAPISPADKEKIAHGNAERVLKI
jgi:uncharacterized protein